MRTEASFICRTYQYYRRQWE